MENRIRLYLKELERHRDLCDYYSVANGYICNSNNYLKSSVAVLIGPIFTSFILYTINSCERKGIKKLFFLSRDGIIFKQIAEIILDKYSIDIEVEVLNISRLSLRNCLGDVSQRRLFNEYLSQKGFYKYSRIGIVDSGWLGNTQKNIEKCLHESQEIHGFYFGIVNDNRKNIFYNSFYINSHDRYINFNYNVFETICSANEGMTIGYEKKKIEILPLKMEYRYNDFVEILQEEIINYTVFFCNKIQKNEIVYEKLDISIEKNIKYFFCYPNREEANTYGSICFDNDIKGENSKSLICKLTKKDLINIFFPIALVNKCNGKDIFDISLWIEGCASVYHNWFIRGYVLSNMYTYRLIKKTFLNNL